MLLPLLLIVFGLAHVAAMRKHGITALIRIPKKTSRSGRGRRSTIRRSRCSCSPFCSPSPDEAPCCRVRPIRAAPPIRVPSGISARCSNCSSFLPESAAFILPLIVTAFLFAIPLFDKRARGAILALLFGGAVAAGGLCLVSYRSDARNPQFIQGEAMARMRAQKAMKLARTLGVPPDGALYLLQNQPDERGGRLFARACTECHTARGNGGEKAPRLDGCSRDAGSAPSSSIRKRPRTTATRRSRVWKGTESWATRSSSGSPNTSMR